jgi:antitoxin ParD1/3/4
MAKNTSVELGTEIAGFVAGQVRAGRYGSASEVIRAGLRLLQNEETKMATLRAALIAGEESGDSAPFDVDSFIASRKLTSHG